MHKMDCRVLFSNMAKYMPVL